jgi:hypothetical protein
MHGAAHPRRELDMNTRQAATGVLRWSCLAPLLLAPLAACGRDGEAHAPRAAEGPPAAPPAASPGPAPRVAGTTHVTDIDLAACLRQARGETTASTCPGYLLAGLPTMIEECAGVGGRLQAMEQSDAWSLDVDADGQAEILIDATQNFGCVGAASYFSCGSLGCPVTLYAKEKGGWQTLGSVTASDAPGIEVLPAPAGTRYRTLRGGCVGERPCDDLTHYTWQGESYAPTQIEAHGYWVDFAPEGLWTLTADVALREAPDEAGAVIERYPAGTVVAIIGKARDADWRYVSPCNACASGFVETGVLQKAE